jgi:hypothetical protein
MMRRFLKNYSLSIVLALLFLGSWILHGLTGWKAYAAEQVEHGGLPALWGSDGFVWRFLEGTFENWQSEFLQLLCMVVLTAWLIHKGSAESRDSSDRMEAKIDEIRRIVEGKRR